MITFHFISTNWRSWLLVYFVSKITQRHTLSRITLQFHRNEMKMCIGEQQNFLLSIYHTNTFCHRIYFFSYFTFVLYIWSFFYYCVISFLPINGIQLNFHSIVKESSLVFLSSVIINTASLLCEHSWRFYFRNDLSFRLGNSTTTTYQQHRSDGVLTFQNLSRVSSEVKLSHSPLN